jgi:hypothetical protein
MLELNLIDNTFSHEEYTVPQKYSTKVKWIRNKGTISLVNKVDDRPIVYSHAEMFRFNKGFEGRGKRIGLVFESQSIFPYSEVERVVGEFDLIFTHSSALLEKYNNTRWIPGGGIWVGGKINRELLGGSDGEIKIYEKSKNISMVSSNKSMCKLHVDRLNLANYLYYNDEYRKYVTLFGTFKDDTPKWIPVIDSLADYRYSIVIENFVDKRYFTEKLLNCFATGTIPIYIGATDLSEFNVDGIIQCSTIKDIAKFINTNKDNLEDIYNLKMEAVKQNFELCKKYELIEDYIYDNYLSEITS